MRTSYYAIPSASLGQNAKIPLVKMDSSEAVFYQLALDMADTIEAHNENHQQTVFICPVGPVGQYPYFVKLVEERRLALKNVWFLNMDEYLDDKDHYIDIEDPLSFRGFMKRTVYDRIDPDLLMPEEQRIFPDPARPEALDRLLEALGGADVCYGGIGITGHLAFNEPEPSLSVEAFSALPSRTLSISPETRAANAIGELKGALEDMPRRCVTIGMKQILSARRIRLGVFRDWHRAVVRRAAYGEKTTSFPVTLLQGHPDAVIYVNDVASR